MIMVALRREIWTFRRRAGVVRRFIRGRRSRMDGRTVDARMFAGVLVGSREQSEERLQRWLEQCNFGVEKGRRAPKGTFGRRVRMREVEKKGNRERREENSKRQKKRGAGETGGRDRYLLDVKGGVRRNVVRKRAARTADREEIVEERKGRKTRRLSGSRRGSVVRGGVVVRMQRMAGPSELGGEVRGTWSRGGRAAQRRFGCSAVGGEPKPSKPSKPSNNQGGARERRRRKGGRVDSCGCGREC